MKASELNTFDVAWALVGAGQSYGQTTRFKRGDGTSNNSRPNTNFGIGIGIGL